MATFSRVLNTNMALIFIGPPLPPNSPTEILSAWEEFKNVSIWVPHPPAVLSPLLNRLLLLSLLCKLLVISSCGCFLSLRMRPLFSHPTVSSWTASSTPMVSITKYAHEFLTLGSLFWAPDRHILLILPTRYICFGLNYPKLCLAPKLSHNSHLLLLPGPQFVQD